MQCGDLDSQVATGKGVMENIFMSLDTRRQQEGFIEFHSVFYKQGMEEGWVPKCGMIYNQIRWYLLVVEN